LNHRHWNPFTVRDPEKSDAEPKSKGIHSLVGILT
jgi:hypothetical protein